jgi:hypothetical protein
MEYIFLIALGWFIQEFEPFKYFADWLYSKLKPNSLIEYVFGSLECWQCCTFWSALAITWSFEKAVIASFITFVLQMLHEGWMRRR